MAEKKVSKAFSFEGWDIREWVKANKGNIRLILSAMLGLGITALSGWEGYASYGLGGLVTAVSKLALDSFDYYVSD